MRACRPRRQRDPQERPGDAARGRARSSVPTPPSGSPGQRLEDGRRVPHQGVAARRVRRPVDPEDDRPAIRSTGRCRCAGRCCRRSRRTGDGSSGTFDRAMDEVCDHFDGGDMDYLTIEGVKPYDGRYEFDLETPRTDDPGVGLDQTPLRLSAVDDRRGVPWRRPGAVRGVCRHRVCTGPGRSTPVMRATCTSGSPTPRSVRRSRSRATRSTRS